MELFVNHLGDNMSGHRWLYMTTDKTLSPTETIDLFALHVSAIANEMRPLDGWRAPIWVSLLCDETEAPVVVSLQPKWLEVLFASENDTKHIEHYRANIEGTPEHAVYLEQQAQAQIERDVLEAKRAKLRAKGQLPPLTKNPPAEPDDPRGGFIPTVEMTREQLEEIFPTKTPPVGAG
jgi:hypothetical protein